MEVFGNTPGAIRTRDGRLWIPMRKALAWWIQKFCAKIRSRPVILTHVAWMAKASPRTAVYLHPRLAN